MDDNKNIEIQKELSQKAITELQLQELMITDLSPELKEKIRLKYLELAKKYPKWKRHRLMRKAGETYMVKFDFVQ